MAWLNGLVNKQNGYLDQAIAEFRSILEDRYPEIAERGFDFSKDYEVINELGQTLFERAKMERGEAEARRARAFLREAVDQFEKTLRTRLRKPHGALQSRAALQPARRRSESRRASQAHERYRPDDNARDRAIAIARRRDPAARPRRATVAIYPLHRPGAPELPTAPVASNREPGLQATDDMESLSCAGSVSQ